MVPTTISFGFLINSSPCSTKIYQKFNERKLNNLYFLQPSRKIIFPFLPFKFLQAIKGFKKQKGFNLGKNSTHFSTQHED